MGKYVRSWSLDKIYPSVESKEFKIDFDKANNEIDALIKESSELPEISKDKSVAEKWEKFYKKLEDFEYLMSQLSVYVSCKSNADSENESLMVLESKVSTMYTKASPISIKLSALLKKCDDDTFKTFIKNSSYLSEIGFAITEARNNAKFTMDEEREKLTSKLSNDGIIAWSNLYDKISGKLKIELMERGEIVKKSVGQVRYESENRGVRQNEFFASLKAWESVKDVCASALNHISGTRLTLYKERGLNHYLDKPLMQNRLKKESLDAMWNAGTERKPMFKKYFELKAKLLGIKKLSWYDITAPMEAGKIDFDSAMDIIIREYKGFNPVMGDFAKWCIENGFIESENRSGKRQGAYCTEFSKRKEPRVFMTFTDSYDSMSTLAHELGHGFHSYVMKDRPLPLRDYPMNLAETASTFGEAIIGDYLLKNAKNDAEKISMLDKMIADAVTYLMNIHSRFIFECRFYEKRAESELTPDELTTLMLDAQREAFIDLLDEYNPLFWASKLHFYISGLSFYNFPYTFGYLFSNALFAIAKERGKEFTETYNNILIATGCMNTEEVVSKNLGMDITKKDFWNKSLDLIEQLIHQFVKLVG